MKYFELKIPPLLLAILFAIAMFFAAGYLPTVSMSDTLSLGLALLSLLLGMVFCIAGVAEFKRHQTTVDPRFPEKVSSLVSGGIYKFSRNPMYVGFALFLLALVFLLNSPVLVIGVFGFVLYMNRFQIVPEELMLKKLFGDQYQRYQERVRRWL